MVLPRSKVMLERAIEMFTAGVSIKTISIELKERYDTVWRWTRDKEFIDEVNLRLAELRKQRERKMKNAANDAVSALQKLLRSLDQRVIQQAAVTILERTDSSELKEAIEESKAVLKELKSATKE